MSVTNPRDEYEALLYATERLAHHFPSIPEDEILELVAAELAAFDHAKVRTYVPVLVEGTVLRRLRRLTLERSAHDLIA